MHFSLVPALNIEGIVEPRKKTRLQRVHPLNPHQRPRPNRKMEKDSRETEITQPTIEDNELDQRPKIDQSNRGRSLHVLHKLKPTG